jgi:hypothetical protein
LIERSDRQLRARMNKEVQPWTSTSGDDDEWSRNPKSLVGGAKFFAAADRIGHHFLRFNDALKSSTQPTW